MDNISKIGVSVLRKEAWDKVTGGAKYNSDILTPDILHAKMLTSSYSHALINKIDISKASQSKGVQAIITGDYLPILTGSIMSDRPPIAKDKVRYFGEPVAIVIANSEEEAMKAVKLIEVDYEPLPVVGSIKDSIKPNALLIHEDLGKYYCPDTTIYPQPNSNILDHVKVRKGDVDKGWKASDIVIEENFSLPQSDHLAMETRNAKAQISSDGRVVIHTSSQAPFAVKEELSNIFGIPEEKIIVHVPLVGGAFGGKATVNLEFLAYLASKAVGGRLVRIANSREEDIATSPCKIGSEATIKIGATKDGLITALKSTYFVDCGAYADTGPRMAKAIAGDCTGPYNIENVHCDVFSVYTNHSYVTSYRGFGHVSFTFAMERILDKLAASLKMDPLDLRIKNALSEGDTSPTQAKITLSNTGNLPACILKLKEIINWDEGNIKTRKDGMIRAKGISCFWKTVASMTTFMIGNAAIKATEDLIHQLKSIGAIILKCTPEDLGIANQQVYLKDDPEVYIEFKKIMQGYEYPGGQSILGHMSGRGSYIMKHLVPLDKETGMGKTGVSWTVGAQAIEIEYDPQMHTYRLLNAATVIDVGKVINPKIAKGVIMGGVSMGLGLATREEFLYNKDCILENTSLRTYKLIRFGEQPKYLVDFVETPQIDAPFGARGLGEHGILGMPAAFANAISAAAGVEFNQLPISPELIWKTKTGGKYDTL